MAAGLPSGDEAMVVHPNKMQTDKKLDELELSIDGFGIPISYKVPSTASTMPLGSPTEPAGALKSEEATQVPEKVPQEEKGVFGRFLDRLSIVNAVKGMANPQIKEELSGFYETVKNAFKLPGDVYGGKIDPSSPQGIERAFDLASLAVLGPAPVAAKMADGTLGSFAGVKSKAVDKPSLRLAQEAELHGLTNDEIHKGTGWFRGADKQWRYEIDDSTAKLNDKWADNPSDTQKQLGFKAVPLPEVIDHPELYAAYPQLKDYKVVYDNNFKGIAEFSGETITVGKQAYVGNTPAYKDKSIIMHEVQHAIQDIEGFAKGGTPGKADHASKGYRTVYDNEIDKLRPELLDLSSKEMKGEFLSAPQQAKLDHLKNVFKEYTDYKKTADKVAFENYQRLSGEVEARNVQHRIDLTPQERMRFNPVDSEDYARSEQITRTQPSMTTPYLDKGDFLTYDKSSVEPTPFRRPANDNQTYKELSDELDHLSSIRKPSDDQFQRILDLNKILTGLEKNPPQK
jgi:hypothetical protein